MKANSILTLFLVVVLAGAAFEVHAEDPTLPASRMIQVVKVSGTEITGLNSFSLFQEIEAARASGANNIVIDKSEISDDHVLLLCRDNKIIIQDQLSANGTFVNEKKIDQRKEVKDNDIIKLGSISFKIKII